jgi:excisionase family DNA binding protein
LGKEGPQEMNTNPAPKTVFMSASTVPIGGGEFKIVPGKPLPEEVSVRVAARFLGISRAGVYRLLDKRVLAYRRPTAGKILISTESLQAYKEATKDPEFWQRLKAADQAKSKRPKIAQGGLPAIGGGVKPMRSAINNAVKRGGQNQREARV